MLCLPFSSVSGIRLGKISLEGGVAFMSCNESVEYIFRPYITLKNGRRLYAWQCGKKAFRFPVKQPK